MELTISNKKVVIFDGAEFGQDDGFYYQVEEQPGSNTFGVDHGPFESEALAKEAARQELE